MAIAFSALRGWCGFIVFEMDPFTGCAHRDAKTKCSFVINKPMSSSIQSTCFPAQNQQVCFVYIPNAASTASPAASAGTQNAAGGIVTEGFFGDIIGNIAPSILPTAGGFIGGLFGQEQLGTSIGTTAGELAGNFAGFIPF